MAIQQFDGRTAFITGGAAGIGLGIARALAKEGARLALVDVDQAGLDAAKAELSELTAVEAHVLDVRDRDRYREVADEVEAKLGAVSLLFNNAGVAGGEPTTEMTYETWDWMVGVNLFGVVNGIQTFMPRMLARGGDSHIVNTASGAGLVVIGAGVMYTATKFAVVGMSEALRHGLAKHDIGVSVLCPGYVDTDIFVHSQALSPRSSGRKRDDHPHSSALANGVSPDDVGIMVLEAIKENRLYIYTDDMIGPYLEQRHRMLLEALEPVSKH